MRYIKRVRKAHHLIRHGCAVPLSPQREGFGFASGKLRSYRTPGRSPLRVRASPTGDGGRRSDVGILRDSSSSLPTGDGARTAGCRPYGRVAHRVSRTRRRGAQCAPESAAMAGYDGRQIAGATMAGRLPALQWRADSPRYDCGLIARATIAGTEYEKIRGCKKTALKKNKVSSEWRDLVLSFHMQLRDALE